MSEGNTNTKGNKMSEGDKMSEGNNITDKNKKVTDSTVSIFDRPVHKNEVKQSAFLFGSKATDDDKDKKEESVFTTPIVQNNHKDIKDDPTVLFCETANLFLLGDERIEERGVGKLYIKKVDIVTNTEDEKSEEEEVVKIDKLSVNNCTSDNELNTSDKDSNDDNNSNDDKTDGTSNDNKPKETSNDNSNDNKPDGKECAGRRSLYKLTMVREKIGLLACNHYILSPLHNHTNKNVLILTSMNDNTLPDKQCCTFLVKFKEIETLNEFQRVYEQCLKENTAQLVN